MTPQDIITVVLGDELRIVDAISAGAGWEVWMQVEFVILCRQRGWQVAREIPYPGNSGYKLDFLLGDQQQQFPVEMKVESATNAGAAVLTAFRNDVDKLDTYPADAQTTTGYVLGLAYSSAGRNALQTYAGQGQNRLYQMGQSIGVLVESVTLQ